MANEFLNILIFLIITFGIVSFFFKKRKPAKGIEKIHKLIFGVIIIMLLITAAIIFLGLKLGSTISGYLIISSAVIASIFWILMIIDTLCRKKYYWTAGVFFFHIFGALAYYQLEYGEKPLSELFHRGNE